MEGKPLTDLPVLTKTQLMGAFDELVTDRAIRLSEVRAHLDQLQNDELFLGKYRVTRTAGSTGNPGVFLHNPKEWSSILASYSRAQEWAGISAGLTRRTRLAVVSSRVPWHQSARVGSSVNSPFIPVKRFDATDPIEEIVAGLNAWRPENLIAYAAMAGQLAEEQIAGRLHIAPRAVMCSSEVLTRATRGTIDRAWGIQPFNVYAATETAGIAAECTRHRLHLFQDLVIAEVVNEDNRPVPPGTFGGKLLVTVLFSRTLPLIRYELSDRVMLSEQPCDCGLPFLLLEEIEGRAEDVLHLRGRSGGSVAIHPNLFHDLLEPLPLRAWQVIEGPDAIRVLLVEPALSVNDLDLAGQVLRALEQAGVAAPAVRVERTQLPSKSALGKTPLIVAQSKTRTGA
ncbi:MAG TPA: hypothetical protein VHO25_20940 [Polyangiaceae bacterium]|nr:hypothetical protein [Polyangiaceae bacterium]